MRFARVLLMLLRIGVTLQLVVGIAMWTGHWYSMLEFHMIVGIVFVLVLWLLALAALVQRRHVWLALIALPWGVVVIIFGLVQTELLAGRFHFVIRIWRLLSGLAAMAIAEQLGRKQESAPPGVRSGTA